MFWTKVAKNICLRISSPLVQKRIPLYKRMVELNFAIFILENDLVKTLIKIVRNKYNNSTKRGSGNMSITATELKNNLGKYLLLSETQDVFITKNGKIVAKLTNPYQDRVEIAKSLFGILPENADVEIAKEERLGIK